MKRILFYISIAAAFFPLCLNADNVVKARDFGVIPDDGEDDAVPLRKLLESIKGEKGVKILLEKGVYDFIHGSDGPGHTYAIIYDMKDLTIDGRGARIVTHHMFSPFGVVASDGVTIKNLSVESKELPFALATVTAVGDNSFDCEVIAPHKAIEATPKAVISYDVENRSMAKGVDVYQLETQKKTELLSETSMRVPLEPWAAKPRIGETVVVRYEVYGPSAIYLASTKNTKIVNFSIASYAGMGIYAGNSENIFIDKMKVSPRIKGAAMSATADATHFNRCMGSITIKNSFFELMGDDAANIHQMYWILDEIIDPKTVKLSFGRKVAGFQPDHAPFVGDIVEFGSPKNWLRLGFSTKASDVIVNKEEEHVIVKLEEPLPADTPVGVFVSNATAKPKLTIKDTTVRGNRARGFLIQTSKALVENCKFDSISGPAILVECDGSFWFEGATTSDLTVKNSTFKNCDIWSGASRTAILADASYGEGVPREGPVHGTIRLKNNKFIDCGFDPFKLRFVETIEESDNTIK